MRYLGIDYGSRRIGVAISDQEGRIAFPREVVANDSNLVRYIALLCEKEKVGAIVLGQSLDYKGKPNPIQLEIEKFGKKLSRFCLQNRGSSISLAKSGKIENLTGLPVHYQQEFLTSSQASRNTAKSSLDASAAALILQTWLDKKNNP